MIYFSTSIKPTCNSSEGSLPNLRYAALFPLALSGGLFSGGVSGLRDVRFGVSRAYTLPEPSVSTLLWDLGFRM